MNVLFRIIIVGSWLAYLLGFPFLYAKYAAITTLFALIPVGLSAWRWKRQGGMIAAVIASLVSMGHLFYVLDESAAAVFSEYSRRLLEASTYLVSAYLIGWISHLRHQLKKYKRVSDEANFDSLTGLLNRSSFEQKLTTLIESSKTKQSLIGVLFVDLDKFKQVNDNYGHDIGDELLKQVARILKSSVRQADVVARLGGDEFMLILSELQSSEAAAKIAAKIVTSLSEPIKVSARDVCIGASIGVSIFPHDGKTAQELIKRADTAMYSVKASGRNHFEVNNSQIRNAEKRQKELQRQLQFGFDNREFELFYQPQFDLLSGRLVGFEVLLRWQSETLGLVKPGEFLPLAESIGLLLPLDRWVLRETCHQLAKWRDKGIEPPIMSLNISDIQFNQNDFVEFVAKAIADYRIDPKYIELELSERVISQDARRAQKTARALMNLGVGLILDDFGLGYASLSHLQRIPFTALKVDRSCLDKLHEDRTDRTQTLLEIIVFLGHKLGKRVMAEGVEAEFQHRLLVQLEYDVVQGFYYDKPVHMNEAEKLLGILPDDFIRPYEETSVVLP